MNKLKKRRKSGFTLIEMVVVIAIVVIIAAIAIPQALKAINKSRASTDIANARTYAGEIMTKVADGTIKFSGMTTSSPLTASTPLGFGITPTKPKLVEGVFHYRFVDDTTNKVERVEISIVQTGGTVHIIYPEVNSTDYNKYVNESTPPSGTTTTTTPTT